MAVLSLTNNEVKFLVTLDIDETKSKKKIDGFLTRTIKDQKIVFDVAVGKSNHNINEFLKKHKEKKASILFDVAVGKSNKQISEYLTSRKQDTQSLIFYVNENATRAKINGSLSKMTFNPALVELKVNTKLSVSNINKFIDNSKLHKKKIELDIDEHTAFTGINTKIFNKKLNNGRINLALEGGAFDSITKNIKEKLFTGARITGQLDVESTTAKITQQISKMKLPKIIVDVEAIVSEKTAKPTTTTTTTSAPSSNANATTNATVKTLAELKEEYKSLGQTVELFNKSRSEGEEAFVKRLKQQGKQVDVIRNAQTNEITKITTTYKNSANEIQKDVFLPITRSYKEAGNASNGAIKEVNGFVKEVTKLKNTEKFNLTNEIEKFKRKLEEARHTATATTQVIERFWNRADGATSRNQIDKLNNDLAKHQAEQRKRNQLDKEQVQLVAQRNQLMANLTRIQKMYLKTVDKDEAKRLEDSIKAIGRQDIFQAKGKDLYKLDMGSVREAKEQISIVNNDIKKLNANATEASKASLGVMSSLKTAMEKFPIWMIASTAFYGVVATFREFGTVIFDIDKKMTDLKKVMSPDTDFGAIFERATASAETFGKTISEAMDAYNMFAKQGFKGEELETLANAGLVAGNVGDIEAGKASEYLTASILQWNKETGEAMGVVDSWNEISNNFATTVENLAQGQAKAGATARALGMDFDQLNAVVGTLNARTKQSGKSHCPLIQ